MLLVNKEVVATIALDSDYEACYQPLGDRRWYSVAVTTRLQEIQNYGRASERRLPTDEGSGYIWRLYNISRFEERDGGVYVELEAIALSRDVPAAVRWIVAPIIRSVSRNSLLISLRQTEEAVRSAAGNNRITGTYSATGDSCRTTLKRKRLSNTPFRREACVVKSLDE
jgi:hypothetical protein